jgi:3-hydroxypropanoate dehydrogenase
MSSVKKTVVDEAFLSGAHWKSDLINVGYGDRTKLFDRLPRLDIRTPRRIL